jgi:hypothetical protein
MNNAIDYVPLDLKGKRLHLDSSCYRRYLPLSYLLLFSFHGSLAVTWMLF